MKQHAILLVDDEPWFVDALAERLSLRGFAVTVAYDGKSALEHLKSGIFFAAVFDLQLPDIQGLEILRRIREEGNDIRVVILTAHGGEEEKAKSLALGAAGFFNKPAPIDEIEKLLKPDGEDEK
jgi:DNA-binding response OmpR family regulator